MTEDQTQNDSRQQNKAIEQDDEGYLLDLDSWTESIANAIAHGEGITLGDEHWEIIYLLRRFYEEYGISPVIRVLVKTVKEELGADKGNSIYLMQLFPGSPAKLAAKIAGLPKPTNCL
ncbi:MAG: TusE/DsrC/DsvC family sulfur relay protein [Pseudomonadales bacterium]|nr:TusE/DsrC/DsvC family sulfur relay protein [Pseudomonadales bacterium]